MCHTTLLHSTKVIRHILEAVNKSILRTLPTKQLLTFTASDKLEIIACLVTVVK